MLILVTVLVSALLYTPGDMVTNCLKNKVLVGIRCSFFSERVINAWNGLPTYVDFRTLAAFKRKILSIDFSSYLKRY